MANRMDIVSTRSYEQNGEPKTAWTRIGTAWEMPKGGWRCNLDAMPIPSLDRDGKLQVSFMLMEPKLRDRNDYNPQNPPRGQSAQGKPRQNRYDDADDSDVPF